MRKRSAYPPPGFDQQIDLRAYFVGSNCGNSPTCPEWHREILDKRLKDFDADPRAGES